MAKKLISLTIITILTVSLLFINISAAPSSWAKKEVNSAKSAGLVPDSLMSNFQNPITREEFCVMAVLLYERLTNNSAPQAVNPFTDTDNPAVSKAHALQIVNGVSEGIFAPSAKITRQEICTMLARATQAAFPDIVLADYPNSFPDISSIADWALKSVKYINIKEIMLGDEEGRINPLADTTREQAILLVLRTKISFTSYSTSTETLESYGFVNTGNTASNMLNGAFAINYNDGNLYINDSKGIYYTSNDLTTYMVNEPVLSMYISSDKIYYIKSSDQKIYKKSYDNEKLLCDIPATGIVPANNDIYFKGVLDSQIYSVPAGGGNATLISDGASEYGLPVSAGNTIIYASEKGIYSYSLPYKTTTVLYEGYISDLCFDNSVLYFKNEKGLICSLDNKGGSYKEITKVSAKAYCIYQTGIAFTQEDGLYKTNKNGSFCIKIDDGNYEAINSYNNYIYAKSADGSILKLKNDASEKNVLN